MILEDINGNNNSLVLSELVEYLKENPTELEPGENEIEYIETEHYEMSIYCTVSTNASLDYDEGDYYTAPQEDIVNANDFSIDEFKIIYNDDEGNEYSFELDSDDRYEIADLFEINYKNHDFDNDYDYDDDEYYYRNKM